MSFDLWFACKDPARSFDRAAARHWFGERGYDVSHPSQACMLTEDGDMPWEFDISGRPFDPPPPTDRPVIAVGSTGWGDEAEFNRFLGEVQAFAIAFDLVFCDPQDNDKPYHFHEAGALPDSG